MTPSGINMGGGAPKHTPGRALVTVTVSGLTGSGKSAVYGEIVMALTAIGVPVVHADEKAWRSECHMTHADWQTAFDLYKPTVVIREQNFSRKPPKPNWAQRLRAALAKARGEQVQS